ncbi:MAG: S26 family signal peptidase, partial [Pirellulaceae bacterium]|nr:S26 family signal peptidase [Pirellulaceae bacterium]
MNRGRAAAVATRSQSSSPAAQANATAPEIQTTRETIESVVVAVVLAFLFRAFVAEAFVIPTGSMAPTLQGRHLDIYC